MKITEQLTCDCNPGKIYASKSSFKTHFKSKRHKQWENSKQELEHRKKNVLLENEIISLKCKLEAFQKNYISLDKKYNKLKELYLTVIKKKQS